MWRTNQHSYPLKTQLWRSSIFQSLLILLHT